MGETLHTSRGQHSPPSYFPYLPLRILSLPPPLQEAAKQVASAKADVAAAEKRAAGAESDLARVRAEAMRVQQDSKAQR